jgi:putative NADH-flavin reductase
MRVFVTGATGFIGSAVVAELIGAGHHVVGLTRSDEGAEALARVGAEVFRGDVNDLDRLRTAAAAAEGVIYTAFNHDFSKLKQHSEEDRKVIETPGEVLAGSDRPLVISSGTGLARSKIGGPAVETDDHVTSAEFSRAVSEEAADALIAKGGCVMVMRNSQVHDVPSGPDRTAYSCWRGKRAGWHMSARARTAYLPCSSPTPSRFTGWRWRRERQARATTP